jgi:hypothetical protein
MLQYAGRDISEIDVMGKILSNALPIISFLGTTPHILES